MKKILTVVLGILLLIFPFAGCKEQEQFDPNKPLLRDYDFVYLARHYSLIGETPSTGNVKKSWKTDGNESYMLAHNYKTFKKYVEEYTYLDVEDLCNKSLFLPWGMQSSNDRTHGARVCSDRTAALFPCTPS